MKSFVLDVVKLFTGLVAKKRTVDTLSTVSTVMYCNCSYFYTLFITNKSSQLDSSTVYSDTYIYVYGRQPQREYMAIRSDGYVRTSFKKF